jgi:general secretion pathway protein F
LGAYEYTALDAGGNERSGVLEGDGPRQIRQKVREQGWLPLHVAEVSEQKKEGGGRRRPFVLQRGVSAAELSLITRQLATLVGSGLPLEEALEAVAQQCERPALKRVMVAVRSRVLEGHALAVALADFPRVFSELFRATVAAGEQSGYLHIVLERLADYTENRQALQKDIMQALIYPVFLVIIAVLMVTGLLTYVVPQVVQVFADIGQELPRLTRWLIASSEFLRQYGVWLVLLLVAGTVVARLLLRNETMRVRYHRLLLRLPLLSRLVRGLNAARFSRTLSILIDSGVPLLDALRIASQVITNLPMRQAVTEAALRVSEGTSLHRSLERSGYFPPLTIHLVASGESSGKLEAMLDRAATSQERDLSAAIQLVLAILGPAVILLMGGMVLLIVLAMLLPIFELNQLVI